MLAPSPPPPAAVVVTAQEERKRRKGRKGGGRGRGEGRDVVGGEVEAPAAPVSCAGQAMGSQDELSKPRMPAGCLTRDPNMPEY